MLTNPFLVDGQLFVGRIEEQKQFRTVLQEMISPPPDEILPYIYLLYGDGGTGKTSLAKRFIDIARTEPMFANRFISFAIDWSDERKKLSELQVGRSLIPPDAVFTTFNTVARRDYQWGRQFAHYGKVEAKLADVNRKVAEALTNYQPEEDWGVVAQMGAHALSRLIRYKLPLIGAKGEAATQTFFEGGIKFGAEKLSDALPHITTYLQARLDPDYYDTFLHPYEQLAEGVGRGLFNIAKKQPLIIFLDSYETIDHTDIWVRSIMRHAGPKIIWIIAGQNDLVRSRQFGHDYFKGYADDYPRRLLTHHMKPLAIQDIHTFFEQQIPKRPLSLDESALISRATRGIPLAIKTAADMWHAETPLPEIIGNPEDSVPGEQIVRQMTDRYLQHVKSEEDRIALYALTLANGDVELLRIMLKEKGKPNFDLSKRLQQLEREYASVDAYRAELHPDPAAFFTHYLKAPIRRTDSIVRSLNQSITPILEQRFHLLDQNIPQLEDRMLSENWCQHLLALINHHFWLDERNVWPLLIPNFLASLVYNPNLSLRITHLITEWEEWLTQSATSTLALLQQTQQPNISAQHIDEFIQFIQVSQERGWLNGSNQTEYEAILHLFQAKQQFHKGNYPEVLRHLSTAQQNKNWESNRLTEQLIKSTELLYHQILIPAPTLIPPSPTDQIEIPEKIKQLLPADSPIHQLKTAVTHQLPTRTMSNNPQRPPTTTNLTLSHEDATPVQTEKTSTKKQPEKIIDDKTTAVPQRNAPSTPIQKDKSVDLLTTARLAKREKKYQYALALYQQILDTTPGHGIAWLEKGELLQLLGKHGKAKNSFTEAYDLLPDNPRPTQKLGELLIAAGEINQAQKLYEESLKQIPNNPDLLFPLAQIFLQKNQLKKAQNIYQQIIRKEPHNPEPYFPLGSLLLQQEKYSVAERIYQRLVKLAPNSSDAHTLLGESLAAQKKFSAALESFRQAIIIDKTNPEPIARAAAVYKKQRQFVSATKLYKKALSIKSNASWFTSLADLHVLQKESALAIHNYEKGIHLDPTDTDSILALGTLYQQANEPEKCEQLYQSALEQNGTSQPILDALAELNNPQPIRAILQLEEAISKEPNNPQATFRLAELYMQSELWEKAEKSYQDTKRLSPGFPPAYIGLANLARQKGDLDKATHYYSIALELDDQLVDAHFGLGEIKYLNRGQQYLAINHYTDVLHLQPNHIPAIQRISAIHVSLGKEHKSIQLLSNAITQQPNEIPLLLDLSQLYKEKNPHEAIALLQRAQELDAQNPFTLIARAELHVAQSETKPAIALYKTALSLDPTLPDIPFKLAKVYQQTGNYTAAIPLLRDLLNENHKDSQVTLSLAEIYTDLGEYSKARELWLHLQKITPYNSDSYFGLATLELAEKNYDNAIRQFTLATDYNKKFTEAYLKLGDIYYSHKHSYQEAEQSYRKILEYHPSSIPALIGISRSILQLGRYQDSYARLSQLYEVAPKNDQLYSLLAQLSYDQKQLDQAMRYSRKAIRLNPDNENAYLILGQVAHHKENLPLAIKSYEKLLDLTPNDLLTRSSLAGLYRRINHPNFQKEIALIEPYLERQTIYNQACFLSIKGNISESITLLQKLLSQYPQLLQDIIDDPDFYFLHSHKEFQDLVKLSQGKNK